MRARTLFAGLVAAVALAVVPGRAAALSLPPIQAKTTGTYAFAKDRAAIANRLWRVQAQVFTGGGGNAIVRLYRGDKVVLVRRPGVRADGSFDLSLRVSGAGLLTVEVVRPTTGERAKRRVWVLDPSARSGASMRFLQQRLGQIGFWPGGSGRYDLRTRWAVMAYRKVNRLPRSFALNRAIFERVARGAGRFVPKYGATGRNRVEADLSRQVYVLLDKRGRVYRVVATSTGKPSTPSDRGRFRFYRKQPGVNGVGMVNSVYYNGGEALHGYKSVPTYAASGGCLRTPTTYSRSIMRWIRLGDRIDVYR